MIPGRARPLLPLAGLLVALGVALLVPSARAWLTDEVWAPLDAQARGEPGGYSIPSLAFWALVGLALAWPAYALVFARLRYQPDRAFFLTLAPFLVAAPLAHALLAAGAVPYGSLFAYAAAEPPIYLTAALVIVAALAAGRAAARPVAVPAAVGGVLLAALLALAALRLDAERLGRAGIVLGVAAAPTLALGYAYWRWRRDAPLDAVLAVVGAHALDGASTWMVLRDPFDLGFEGFSEKNPFSLGLVGMSNGWPFFAVKLALPLVLLSFLKKDEGDEATRAFLLFAVFVLGYGPGMANLLQVILG